MKTRSEIRTKLCSNSQTDLHNYKLFEYFYHLNLFQESAQQRMLKYLEMNFTLASSTLHIPAVSFNDC